MTKWSSSLKPPVEKIRVEDIYYCTLPPQLAKVTNSRSEYFILRHYNNVLYVFVKIICISLKEKEKKVLAPRAGFWMMWSHLVSLPFLWSSNFRQNHAVKRWGLLSALGWVTVPFHVTKLVAHDTNDSKIDLVAIFRELETRGLYVHCSFTNDVLGSQWL